MQELVLIQPIRAAGEEWSQEAAHAVWRREFEARLAECGSLAYRVARGVLRNDADAEDVAQEALLRAYRRFERLRDPRCAFAAGWCASCSDWRWIALVRLNVANCEKPNGHSLRGVPRPETLRNSRRRGNFRRISILLLAAMEGHSLEAVAGMLGLPVGTVKSRLFVGRKKLAEKLQCYVTNTKTR
jgi:RNA polymerase sigma-70 factor (ECF subfamily)